MDWPRCSPKCPVIMVKEPRTVDCIPNIFCGLSASPSFSASVALRRCANDSFNPCRTLGLSPESALNCLEIDAVGNRRAQRPRHPVVRRRDVREDFPNRTYTLARTPHVLFRWDRFRQASVSLLVIGDHFEELRPEARRRRGGGHRGGFGGRVILALAGRHHSQTGCLHYKETKTST